MHGRRDRRVHAAVQQRASRTRARPLPRGSRRSRGSRQFGQRLPARNRDSVDSCGEASGRGRVRAARKFAVFERFSARGVYFRPMDHANARDRHPGELEARGMQPTAQRMRIAELLFARDQHLTAEQMIETLRAGDAGLQGDGLQHAESVRREGSAEGAEGRSANGGCSIPTSPAPSLPRGGHRRADRRAARRRGILAPAAAAAWHRIGLRRRRDPGPPPGSCRVARAPGLAYTARPLPV